MIGRLFSEELDTQAPTYFHGEVRVDAFFERTLRDRLDGSRLLVAEEVLEPLVEVGELAEEGLHHLDELVARDDLLVEEHQTAQEVLVRVLVLERLAHLSTDARCV